MNYRKPAALFVARRARASFVLLQLVVAGLLLPTMKICEDEAGHRQIESITSDCCAALTSDSSPSHDVWSGSTDERAACAGACTDTLLVSIIEAPVVKRPKAVERHDVLAVVESPGAFVADLFDPRLQHTRSEAQRVHANRQLVLRI